MREQANQALMEQIQTEYRLSRQTYGSPRIQAALRLKGGTCGRHRVAHLMHQGGLCARPRRKGPVTTRRQPGVVPAPNRLNQDFSAPAPNCKWVSDFT
jgi:putative transposase